MLAVYIYTASHDHLPLIPETMARAFLLACFSPFSPRDEPPSSSVSSSSSSNKHKPDSNDEALTFFSSLLLDFEDLEKSLEEYGPVSLHWCWKALLLVKKMHSHFLLIIERLPHAFGSSERINLMTEEYMRESLDLLDLCNLLKSSSSGFGRGRLMVGFAMKSLYEDGLLLDLPVMTTMERIGRKEANFHESVDVKRWIDKSSCKLGLVKPNKLKNRRRLLLDVVGAVQSAIAMICSLVFCSVVQPVPIKVIRKVASRDKYNLLNSFLGATQRLVCCFIERFQVVQENQRRPILSEIEMIDSPIAAFRLQMEAGRDMAGHHQLFKTLEERSTTLKEGLDLFEAAVDGLFDDIIKGRKRVLSLITSNTPL